MAKASDSADTPEVDPNLATVEEPTFEDSKAKEVELKEAQATDDPNDDIEAARPDVGTEIDIQDSEVEVEPEEKPEVKVDASSTFKVPVLEEYQDDNGVTRGRIKSYDAPTDLRIYSSVAHALGESDDDGYVTVPGTFSAAVAADIAVNPAVEVAE